MCGIFGYVGERKAVPILLDGLRDLEYRGYDSAGIFVPSGLFKAAGPVKELTKKIKDTPEDVVGISHTRWATHGLPTERNAHPHGSWKKNIWMVHNGIVENYKELKEDLVRKGHKFKSDTDSEVLVHVIEEELNGSNDIEKAAVRALKKVQGTYGIALVHKKEPEKILVARMGSPIVLGIGDGENFIASDPSAILKHTKDVIYLEDGEYAVLEKNNYKISTLDNRVLYKKPDHIEWDVDQVKKGGYDHFMMKEIMEAPKVLADSMRGRVIEETGEAKLGGIESVKDKLQKVKRLIIVGCGSTYYAGQVGKYLIEELAGIPCEVELGSEFRYRKTVFDEGTALLAVSQSGETADTLASIKEAKRRGLLVLGIVNSVGSTIARETDAGIYNHAGPEIGVASTKAFISQLEVLVLFALFLGRQRNLSVKDGREVIKELKSLPKKIEKILKNKGSIKKLAKKYSKYDDFLYVARGYNFPIAYEGALKLKEVSYIHAEGYGAGEMKHGPIAMIDKMFPTVAVALKDSVYEKMISNIEEIKARKGKVLAIATEGDVKIKQVVKDVIYIPKTSEFLSPILSVIPMQILSYYIGVGRGYDVDRPRNLAKSVTVE